MKPLLLDFRRSPLNRLHRFALRIAALALCMGLAAAAAQTQVNDAEAARLDAASATLKQIYTTLQQPGLSAADLNNLQTEAHPIGDEIQAVIERLTPRLEALKAQLTQLGPAPSAQAAPESAQLASERAQRQKAYDTVDALMKRANLLVVQAEQVNALIGHTRRAKLEQTLFAQERSIADPALWIAAVSEVPKDFGAARTKSADWLKGAAGKLTGISALAFSSAVALVLLLFFAALWILRRRVFRTAWWTPTRLQRTIAAWRVFLSIAGLPIIGIAAIGAIAVAFGLIDPSTNLVRTIFLGVVRVAVIAGIAFGLLAPGQQDRRLLKIDDEASDNVLRTALTLALLVSLSHVIESFAAAVGASLVVQDLLRGTGAFLAVLVLAAALWIRRTSEDQDAENTLADSYDWSSLLRIVLWIATVAVLTAVLAGFMNLASFLINQIIWVGAVGAVTFMLAILVDQATRVGFTQRTRFGRSLMMSTGLRRDSFDQLSVLLSGVTRVLIFVVAVLIALAPWGVQSSDVSGYLYAAFFGFKVGNVTISLSRIAFAVCIFAAAYLVTRTLQRWLDVSFLPRTRLDKGLRNAIVTSVAYIGWILSISFALAYLGLDFEKLAIVAGALSVGIGFGLQSVVNNFVSGLILLWERAIRVGDWISVGSNEGYVRRINVRSTELETFDCAAVVIPNSDLVAGVVKNFVRTDRTGRVDISMGVNAAADPEKARDLFLEIAKAHKQVLETPPPQVNLAEITGSAFNFQLFCYVGDVGTIASVKSDLNFEIYRRFKAENLFAAPAPTLVVSLPQIEKDGIVLKGGDGAVEGQATS